MNNGRDARQIKRMRNELLATLKMVYPSALQADSVLRGMLMLFPTLEFDYFRRDLSYLMDKGYVERVMPYGGDDAEAKAGPWRKRWFKLTPTGLEIVDHCVKDPALDE